MTSSPTKQRAIITGASSGIGKATALQFAKAGIDLALISRSEEKLAAVARAAQEAGVEAKTYSLDLKKIEQVKEKIAELAADFGSIDILVNNAGMGYTGNLSETPLGDWQQVINLNLTSVFQCILGILPIMRDRQKGTIINVASVAAANPFPGWGAYSVSKAGLVALSKTLAAEERANGIRVVVISPGAVNTPIWDTETVQADFNRQIMLTPEIVAQSILHAALLPEQAVVEEMTIMPSAGSL
ncbi:MAG: SDR family oxidoreductase [Oscillatoria sp. PMC 1051.18]|uniref:SDR family oxidoreductase n=1 Tax=Oscillatoria salina TaxID=331517 RepID=UPI0013B732EF|nr:SDR family oxidoreductase [Oscillatoria salina]MBZ8180588.1 SDR family oxidoreductase [Oscillatoria salina IIICB1]MEC4894822.1 SDR family oxidoreductase [Oscillatoria sp. PMC 1050.18]MEC5031360.1 SDR family oxidoreductase [Oscillatoria sp. PMC 1051.18]NET91044.1 SDR family oxidoreductase [Kamptonema sp. SIO1D9]